MNILVVLIPLLAGLLAHFAGRKEFTVHSNGIVLITGASTGIGRHAAEHLAEKHSFLVLAGVRKQSDADSIRKMGVANLQPILIDVTSHDSITNAVAEIEGLVKSKGLPFVGLVNNAGISRKIIAEYHSVDDARSVFETNFFGVLDLIQQTLPLLRESKGRIINLSSIAGFIAAPKFGVYSASKFALEGFSDTLRRELLHFGISVSILEPAFVKSAIHQSSVASSNEVTSETDEGMAMKKLYGHFFDQAIADKREEEIRTADGPIVTSEAIEDALVARYPRTRYAVARAAGINAYYLSWLKWILPDRVADIILAAN